MEKRKIKSIEELEQYYEEGGNPWFDAEFSPLSKRIISFLGAKGMHMNKWWVRTPMDWKCPSCSRNKSQIAKLDHRGFASCHLHEHHDHMKDVVRRKFEEISSARDKVVATTLAERFAVRTSYAVSAYDNTVICADCNKADGTAKKMIGAHDDFSFSPEEIARFVLSQPNREHAIDIESARKIWADGYETFSKRMKLAEYIAGLAASDSHWYQPSRTTAKQTKKSAEFKFSKCGLDELHYEPEKLLYTTVPFKGSFSSWRLTPKPSNNRKPTQGQIAHLSQTRGRYWNRYDDEWHCPCCKRSKYDCLKPSKRNPWVFEVKGVLAFDKNVVSYSSEVKVCNECFNTANLLGREAIEEAKADMGNREVMFPHCLVSLEELQAVVTPRANSSHLIDNQLADKVLSDAINRIVMDEYYYSSKHKAALNMA